MTETTQKAKYVIEFTYTDNNQIYSNDVELTPEEHARVSKFLEALGGAGDIENAESGDMFIFPYVAPRFLSFDELKSNWDDGSLIIYGDCIGVEL